MSMVEQFSSIKQFAEACDMNESHVSQIKNGSSNIGDRLARKLEQKFEKPSGWMDAAQNHGIEDEATIYLAGSTNHPYKPSLDETTIVRATEFLMEKVGLERMKKNGARWSAKTIILLYDLFQDPASEQLNENTKE